MSTKRLPVAVGLGLVLAVGGTIAAVNIFGTDTPVAEADDAPLATSGPGVCGTVNGFTITAVSGPVDCEEALAMSTAYTAAVLAPDAATELGHGLFWMNDGWSCGRNYDETTVTENSHGLICQRGNFTVTLVS